ncbi:MAG: hypothetical protein KQH53_18780 [Desulfarculaceae bacterium]|nr:hypothetical protein [Desulfarculaceae bacterium]
MDQIVVSGSFRYMWLKYIQGVDLDQHCSSGLLGPFSEKVGPTMGANPKAALNEAEALAYYLCGVTLPYRWADNFHLAFVYDPESEIDIERHGIKVRILGAREVPIHEVDPERCLAKHHLHKKAYATCRNWQFANMLVNGEIK